MKRPLTILGKKIIFKRGTKYSERGTNSTKTAINLTATGDMLPIYVVYKGLWDLWCERGSRSGWFDSACFDDWFNRIMALFCINKVGQKVLIVIIYHLTFQNPFWDNTNN